MKRFIIILILFPLMGAMVFGQSAKQFVKSGEEFARTMNFTDAIGQFTKAIELDPDNDKAYIQRAMAYNKLKDYQNAVADFDRAIVFNEKDAGLYYLSGSALHELAENNIALAKLNKAIDMKKNFLEAYQVRSVVLMELERYQEALVDCQKSLKIREDDKGFYNLAQVYERLGMYPEAEGAYRNSIAENRLVAGTHYTLASLLYKNGNYPAALTSASQVLQLDPGNLEGLLLQSQILASQLSYPKAIEVLSLASIEYPEVPEVFLYRGDYYVALNQAANALIDYSRVIELVPDMAEVYYKRAGAYELFREYGKALLDYEKILAMSKYDGNAMQLHEQATMRMFELNREENKPVVTLVDPLSKSDGSVDIPRGIPVIAVTGKITDQSEIKTLQVNNFTVPVEATDDGYKFLASANVRESDQITVQVTDVYDNSETAIFTVRRTEVDAPVVQIIAPYGSENNILYLDNDEPVIYIEGRVNDESRITNIFIESVSASYIPSDINPAFSAMVRIENKTSINVQVVDEFGNQSETRFTLNRDAQAFGDNPMGKTWAIFIENSNYNSFASLGGPTKDVTLMRSALARYQFHNVIHKKNMTKQDMERFFAIELRDLIRSNRVNSIMVWYAGHGKYINETSYWIPTDASRDDEFTYFNVNALKASMQSYPKSMNHTLVITDACESGASFYQAMRSEIVERDCNDWEATRFKSSQVFTSAGNELAVDDSQFTRTFANVLANSPDTCVPIESIVLKVTSAVESNNLQKPLFGKINGLEDEDGTFFFIPKSY
ncbi:MAG: tetratricopeptide repeat protein [Bacteroidetes bacterium]|nr:tetratricopeptide repeat protein [Bacteroidota bacterium]